MIFRPSREPGDDRFVQIKTLLFVVGASVGAAGMVTERMWLVNAGIGVLAIGMILVLISRRRRTE